MNQQSTDSSISSGIGPSAEAISRRAYEIWESEGRPEGCDLRHWLQAEQELSSNRTNSGKRAEATIRTDSSYQRSTDQRPTQPARTTPVASPATAASRDTKRPSTTPFSGEKNGTSSASGQNTAKRKPSAAPVL